jgi:hypothetical protein
VKGALAIDELSGQRWDLAVDLLDTGDGIVSFDHLLLYRDTKGPRPTGVVHVEICATLPPEQSTSRRVESDISHGLQSWELVIADDRVRHLVDQFGLVRHYVYDYETGRVVLAAIEPDGTIRMTV